jgi:hypothetical protein
VPADFTVFKLIMGNLVPIIIAYFNRKKGTNRSEDLKLIEKLEGEIKEIARLSLDYWSKSNQQFDLKIAAERKAGIRALFNEAGMTITTLKIHHINCENQFIIFRQAITGGNFESLNRDSDQNIITKINNLYPEISANARAIYADKYR